MTLDSNPPASGLPARVTGVVVRPRRAMLGAIQTGTAGVLATWAVVLVAWLGAASWLLGQPVGRQAVVDEQVRVAEAMGRQVDDAQYAAWQSRPPWPIYLASGGRILLLPITTVAVAVGMWLWARRAVPGTRFLPALSVAVHASVVLALQQLVSTPLHVVRESLTSPFNLAALLPFFDEGSWPARILGTVEVFGLWWAGLLAVGLATIVAQPVRQLVGPVVGLYLVLSAAAAVAVVLIGGS